MKNEEHQTNVVNCCYRWSDNSGRTDKWTNERTTHTNLLMYIFCSEFCFFRNLILIQIPFHVNIWNVLSVYSKCTYVCYVYVRIICKHSVDICVCVCIQCTCTLLFTYCINKFINVFSHHHYTCTHIIIWPIHTTCKHTNASPYLHTSILV